MFLLVPAYLGCPGSKAVKRSLLIPNDMLGDMLKRDVSNFPIVFRQPCQLIGFKHQV